ncbi:MAG: hypothetical protein FWG37_03385, partial [Clostridia bacterium]|nr:hypothetical protein [Clostridia bacterium]
MKRWFAWLLLLGLLMPAVGFAEIGDAIKAEIAEMELEDIEALLPLLYERMVELSSDIMVPELLLSEEEDTGVRANPARDAIRIVDHAYCEDDNVVIVLENTSEKTVPFFFVQIQYIDGKDEIVHTGRHLHWTILPGHQVVTIYSLWKSDYHDALTLNVSIEVDDDEAVY